MVNDHCGVFGIFTNSEEDKSSIPLFIYRALLSLQHRGHESTGMTIHNGSMNTYKDIGYVKDVFAPETRDFVQEKESRGEDHGRIIVDKLSAGAGIGHNRYSTEEVNEWKHAQPIEVEKDGKKISIAFNGTLSNFEYLKEKYFNQYDEIGTNAEIIGYLLLESLEDNNFERIFNELEGGYAVLGITEQGELIGFRDPLGIRPLCISNSGESYALSSESSTFDKIFKNKTFEEVKPGELIRINSSGIERFRIPVEEHQHCMFEHVYLSRPDSHLDGRDIGKIRMDLGRELAKDHEVNDGMVVPILDSGRYAAEGFALESNLPYVEGIMRDRFIPERSFIQCNQSDRESVVKRKLSFIDDLMSGEKIVLFDDSLVRGTSIRSMIKKVRDLGVEEVHIRISCPPLVSPCFFGLDIPTREELFVSQLPSYEEYVKGKISVKKISKEANEVLGSDSLYYNSIDNLKKAIGIDDLCLGCLNDNYPFEVEDEVDL